MSALGQKQTLDWRPLMSALPPKADMAERGHHVRFVPQADIQSLDYKNEAVPKQKSHNFSGHGLWNKLREDDPQCSPFHVGTVILSLLSFRLG
jgi:hypothetical protein